MSLISWEINQETLSKQLTLTFDNVIKVSTDTNRDVFVVRLTMSGSKLSKKEIDLASGNLDAGRTD